MEIAATISPLTPFLKNIAIARANGAFGTMYQIKGNLQPYRHILTLLDIPHGRRKMRTNNYSDKELVDFAKEIGISYIAISYVASAKDLIYDYPTCAKIETLEGYNNIEEIAKAADILLIDRRDLATAIGIVNVPHAVKKIIEAAHRNGKKVIVASEFLISMLHGSNNEPALSEVHDVIATKQLGGDYICLAEETAIAKNPEYIAEIAGRIIDSKFT